MHFHSMAEGLHFSALFINIARVVIDNLHTKQITHSGRIELRSLLGTDFWNHAKKPFWICIRMRKDEKHLG